MKTERLRSRTLGITLRTALLSWLVTISTLLLFVTAIIPQQKRTFLENLESKAHGVAASLLAVTSGAAVNDDYPTMVDHCEEMIGRDPGVEYIVLAKKDGPTFVIHQKGWHYETNAVQIWRPERQEPVGDIGVMPLSKYPVFHYSQRFVYSGIHWGWIHVGLSLNSYNRNVATVYQRTGMLAILCVVLSLLASGLYAMRLVHPILSLRKVVQKVAGGDLSARAAVQRSDELGSLATSVNTMTEALLQRDRILQSVRYAAEQFLSTFRWDDVIQEVLARIGEAATVSRVYVFENHTDENGALSSSRRFEWVAGGIQPQMNNPTLQNLSWSQFGPTHWLHRLRSSECISVAESNWTPSERALLEPQGIRSLLLIPIRVESAWWGFLGLDECNEDREWTEAQTDSLRAAADMLGAAVTRQRTQDAMVRAKEAAEAASEAKSQFLANMSHEIRTPITGVMGMLQLLERTPLDEKQRRYVSNTMASAESLLKVIGDILDFSKIEAGKLDLEESRFSVTDALDVAVRLLAEKAEAKGLELVCRVAGEVPRQLVGDPNRLQQVLLNLLSNAVKFTERGTVVISCTLIERGETTATLGFEVEDTGLGIEPQQQALIFDAFCQADSSMSRRHGGTGLGLTICRQLVRLMGGQIGVRSVPGQGSTFWFTARFKHAAPADQLAAVPRSADFRGLRVLVVDDCPAVREIVCAYVRAWKGVPEEAPEASMALARLRRAVDQGEPFAVAVLDWRMPGLDGLALARLIKQEPSLQATGLVLLTGFAQPNLASDCETAGFAAWLPKPARRSELYDAIIRAANGRLIQFPNQPSGARRPVAMNAEPTKSGTILLAEDNEINQEVASEMLTAMGYKCVRVRTGREALAGVQNGEAELVLMDCQMPEMDGYEATRLIRQWEQQEPTSAPRGRRLPIVALTAHAMKGDRARRLEAGMDDYMTKPLQPEELVKVLARWMPRPGVTALLSGEVQADASRPVPLPVGIDFHSLLHRCMGKEDLAMRLVGKFLTQAGEDVKELETAIREQDAARVRLVAHRLKGAAANVSAGAIREIASRLEVFGRQGDLVKASELVSLLQSSMDAVRATPS